MLSIFRRPGADLQIEVDKTVVQVGEDLRARVTLVPKTDFNVRQGKVELICTETYVQRTSSQYGQYYRRKTQVLSRTGGSFMESGTVRAGLPHSGSVRLVVPAGETREWRFLMNVGNVTAPSLKTEKSSVRWLVKGVLSRRMRPDLRVEREIGVDF